MARAHTVWLLMRNVIRDGWHEGDDVEGAWTVKHELQTHIQKSLRNVEAEIRDLYHVKAFRDGQINYVNYYTIEEFLSS